MSHNSTYRSHDRPVAMRSDGFTLIELIIVMIIIAILIAIAVPFMLGSKDAVRYRATVGAARSYDDSVSAYKLQNRDRNPLLWTSGTAGPTDAVNRPYLRGGIPESVQNRTVQLDFGDAGPPSAPLRYGQVVFKQFDAFNYGFLVRVKVRNNWVDKCSITNVTYRPWGVPPC